MKISENVKKVLIVSLVTLVVILLIRFVGPPFVAAVVYLFSLLSPFIIGYIFARLINPVADRLKKWIKLPRGISAVLVMLLAIGIIGTIVGFLGHRLIEEGKNLYMNREEIILSLQDTWERLSDRFGQLYINMPDAIKSATDGAVNGIYKQCIELAGNISVVDKAQVIAKALPLALIWTIMFILSIYFMVSRNVRLTETVRRYMGEKSADKLAEIKGQCKRYLGGYVKAQMILMLIVFFVISIILSIFRAPYVLLIAALTAILDALPFFGSGIVLWPMAVVYFVDGQIPLGIAYVITYFAIMLMRRFLEPKLVSDGMGFNNPLIMLVAMFIGYRFWGVIGLIAGPLILMFIMSLYKVGLFNGIIAILRQFWRFVVKEFRLFEKYMHDITK